MKDILILYDGEDALKWMGYIHDMLCKNDLDLSVESKDLRTDQKDILETCGEFLVVSILVSPSMLETLSSASDRLAPVLQEHACVSVILLYTELSQLRDQIQSTYKTLESWKSFDITNKPDSENKKTVSEIIDLLEKERREHQKTLLAVAAAEKRKKASLEAQKIKPTQEDPVVKPKPPGAEEKRKQTKRGTRHARSILETVCPKKISKVQYVVNNFFSICYWTFYSHFNSIVKNEEVALMNEGKSIYLKMYVMSTWFINYCLSICSPC